MIPRDTHPEAHRVQMDLYRAMSPERKAAVVAEMSILIRHLARIGIRDRHPEYSEAEVSNALVTLLYGRDVADARRARSVRH
jgi:hypothetical protein